MAATGEIIGTDVTLAYNSASTTWIELAAFTNDDAMSLSRGEAETTAHGTSARTYIAGLMDGEYSFTVMYNFDATLTTAGKPQELLFALFTAGTAKPWRVRPQGAGSTKKEKLFTAFITGFDENFANDDEPVSVDITLKISGAVTEATQS